MALNVQQPHNMVAPQKQAYQSNAYMDNDPRVAGQATVTPTQPVQQNVAQQQGTANNMVTNGGLAGTGTYSGGPNNGQAALEYLDSLYTSPQEEDKLRKASVANQRILAVGDALRHIFNIHNTVKGAPAQQLNSPVMEEYGRYEKGKALRDAANARYYTYQQQKAAQDTRMQQLSDQTNIKLQQLAFNQDKFNRQQGLAEFKAKNDEWYKKATIEQKEKALEIQQALSEGRLSLMEAQRALAEVKTRAGGFSPNRSGGGSGGAKYWAYDENGNIHYYPNKSMYEQGVYEFGANQTKSEYYSKGKDALGREQQGERKRSVTSMGGERARQAHQNNNSKSNPYGDNSNRKKTNHKSNPYG